MRTYDTAYPDNFATATVAITVRRNEFGPVFSPDRIQVRIEETREVGSVITIVNATDRNAGVRFVEGPVCERERERERERELCFIKGDRTEIKI